MELKRVTAGGLEIAYHEFGPGDGPAAILLHGFPYDAHAYDEAGVRLGREGIRVIAPYLRGYGPTRFLSDATPRSGQQAALGADLLALMDALAIPEAVLGGFDWGGRAACIVAALWPERARGLVSCGDGYNIQDIAGAARPAPPEEEARYWYMYYFHTDRGRAALESNRRELCEFIWRLWSPSWAFSEATFAQSARSFENPDFVEIVIHSYRHRFGGVSGDPRYGAIEEELAARPAIGVPAIVLQGADDGVDPPGEADTARAHFTGPYERRILPGIGHNPPQEAPVEFAAAVLRLLRAGDAGLGAGLSICPACLTAPQWAHVKQIPSVLIKKVKISGTPGCCRILRRPRDPMAAPRTGRLSSRSTGMTMARSAERSLFGLD